jgi:hypothetical protein
VYRLKNMYLGAIRNAVILLANAAVNGDYGALGWRDPQFGQQITDGGTLGKRDLEPLGMIITCYPGAQGPE